MKRSVRDYWEKFGTVRAEGKRGAIGMLSGLKSNEKGAWPHRYRLSPHELEILLDADRANLV
jgi:hypothetical protein